MSYNVYTKCIVYILCQAREPASSRSDPPQRARQTTSRAKLGSLMHRASPSLTRLCSFPALSRSPFIQPPGPRHGAPPPFIDSLTPLSCRPACRASLPASLLRRGRFAGHRALSRGASVLPLRRPSWEAWKGQGHRRRGGDRKEAQAAAECNDHIFEHMNGALNAVEKITNYTKYNFYTR